MGKSSTCSYRGRDLLIGPCLITLILFSFTNTAHANAFIPTMLSGSILWIAILPIIIVLEATIMSYWGWKNPYKNSAKANLLSMLIAIPLGIIVCIIGSIILNLEEKYLRALPSDVSFQLAQIFLFGQVSTYNFGFAIEEWMTNDGVVLAAVLYMGICLAFTIWVEGNYHARKNPEIGRKNIFMRTTIIHFCSYMVLLMAWLPYSYYSAKNKEDALKVLCSKNNAGRYQCEKIWSKFPEIYRSSINYNYLNP